MKFRNLRERPYHNIDRLPEGAVLDGLVGKVGGRIIETSSLVWYGELDPLLQPLDAEAEAAYRILRGGGLVPSGPATEPLGIYQYAEWDTPGVNGRHDKTGVDPNRVPLSPAYIANAGGAGAGEK